MALIDSPLVRTALLTGIAAVLAPAQTLTTLVGLGDLTNGSLIQARDGNLYGVTQNGIYRLSLDGTVTILALTTGLSPNTLVQASDGNFYGTTEYGGPVSLGTVFRMTPSGTVTTLYKFGTLATDGSNPIAGLIQASDGNLYGSTGGTIFRVTLGGALTTLYTFGTQSTDGRSPIGGLVQGSDGNIYGVTQHGDWRRWNDIQVIPRRSADHPVQF